MHKGLAAAGTAVIAGCVAGHLLWPTLQAEWNVRAKLSRRATTHGAAPSPCGPLLTRKPLVLLVLGQSNAGNHGESPSSSTPPVHLVVPDGCASSTDPLPGATGTGGSIWAHLPAALASAGFRRPVLFAVLAVDGTTIADWNRNHGALPNELAALARRLQALGITPDLVLWQQGEADAQAATPDTAYAADLEALAQQLHSAGIDAPILSALSTVCRSTASTALRGAIKNKVVNAPRFRLGPDTDTLSGPAFRRDGCHFNQTGLQAAAALWAAVVVQQNPSQ